jgi:hypothetical protein
MLKIISLLLIGGSEKMIQTLSGFLTPIIAITTAIILVLQYLLAKRRWRLDLYDKRYPVYLATMEYLSLIMQKADIAQEELLKFLRNSKDKEFLFGSDVREYLNELYSKGVDLMRHTRLTRRENVEEEKRLRYIDEETELVEWFSKQSEVSKKLFGDYLTIDKK